MLRQLYQRVTKSPKPCFAPNLTRYPLNKNHSYHVRIIVLSWTPNFFIFRISLPKIQTSGTYCLEFYFHMYGFHINRLQVFIDRGSSIDYPWHQFKEQGDQWLPGLVQLQLTKDDRVRIVISLNWKFIKCHNCPGFNIW